MDKFQKKFQLMLNAYYGEDENAYEEYIRLLKKEKRIKIFATVAGLLIVSFAIIAVFVFNSYDNKLRNYCDLELSSDRESYSVTKYDGADAQVFIPSTYRKKPITNIAQGAFRGNNSIEYVTIPDSIVNISESAFSNCTSLTGIVIPDSVVSIGEYAFSDCTSLTEVVISNSVTDIRDYAFSNCTDIVRITLPRSISSIGSSVFVGCSSLFEITFEGTQEEWKEITKAEDWDKDLGFYVIYCDDAIIMHSD